MSKRKNDEDDTASINEMEQELNIDGNMVTNGEMDQDNGNDHENEEIPLSMLSAGGQPDNTIPTQPMNTGEEQAQEEEEEEYMDDKEEDNGNNDNSSNNNYMMKSSNTENYDEEVVPTQIHSDDNENDDMTQSNSLNNILMTHSAAGVQLTSREIAEVTKKELQIVEKMKKLAKRRAVQELKKQGVKHSSAWFLYTMEKRKNTVSDGPVKIGQQMKEWSEEFKSLSEDARAIYDKKAKDEKDAYEKLLETTYNNEFSKIEAEGPAVLVEDAALNTNLSLAQMNHAQPLEFPLARIRKTVKMDPDVKNVSKEAALMITKATELFVAMMAIKGSNVSGSRGSKQIMEKDFVHMTHT